MSARASSATKKLDARTVGLKVRFGDEPHSGKQPARVKAAGFG